MNRKNKNLKIWLAATTFLVIAIATYFANIYMNSNYPLYKNPRLFQLLYLGLVIISLTCLVTEVYLIKISPRLLGKIVISIFTAIAFFIVMANILGLLAVNYFG